MVNPAQWLDPDWKLERNDKKGFHVTGTLGELWFLSKRKMYWSGGAGLYGEVG